MIGDLDNQPQTNSSNPTPQKNKKQKNKLTAEPPVVAIAEVQVIEPNPEDVAPPEPSVSGISGK